MDLCIRVTRFRAVVALVVSCVLIGSAHAQTLPPAVQHGITWLTDQVQVSGALAGEGASIATTLQSREETLITLRAIATMPAALATAVATNTDRNAEYTARRVAAAAAAGQSNGVDVAALIALQNSDGGWGLTSNYASDALDTAFALQALHGANASASVASAGIAWLAQAKLADGGWGVSDASSVYVSANALLAANAWANLDTNASIANAASTWLLAARNATQDYGDAFDNAYGLLSLATQPAQSGALAPLTSALDAAQLSDGSWADDPYVTALALHALWYASAPPTNTTTGAVLGTVIDQATGQPLSGVAIALAENSGFAATTAGDGGFRLNGIPAGTYTLQLSKGGYQARALSIQIAAAQNTNVGQVALAPVSTTASLSGVIKNNSGQALQNVIVAVGSKSTLTDASGAYQLGGIAPGAATINASLVNYQTATASVNFVAGTSYLFSPTLYPNNVTPPATSMQGIVVDATTRQPITGAAVVLGGATQMTDAAGKFVFTNVPNGAFSASVSASGYQGIVVSGSLVAGLNDLGSIQLTTAQSNSSLHGKVLDAQGAAINGATVAISGGPSATSDSTGAYQITGLIGTSFAVTVSATGYVTQVFSMTLSAPGDYTQDFNLVAQQTNAITLGPLTVTPQSAGSNASLSVSTTLVNGGSTPFDGVLLLEVYDASNHLIGSGPLTDASGLSIGAVSLLAGDHLGVIGRWNTGTFAPGSYRFEMRLVEPASVTRATPLGILIANQFASFTITSTTHFSGTVAGDPPVVQAGVNQAVHLTAVVKNDGNVTFAAQAMNLTVADTSSGAVAFTASANLDTLVPNAIATLDFGSWTPAAGGNFQLTVKAADSSLGTITGSLYVGNVAQAAFTVTPDTVLAGTRSVHGNIEITGVNPALATITDPLAPLIRTAIQKAVAFNDPAAHTWIDTNKCSSCHIGNQALIGGELTRQLTTYDALDRNVILNNVSTNQALDGGITEGYNYSGYYRRLGSLTLWGLLGYHNLGEFPTVIKHAADWVTNFQGSNGNWSSDYNQAWFDSDISMSMLNISNMRRVDEFLRTNAIDSVPVYASQTLLANQPGSSRGSLLAAASGNLYYVDQSNASVYLTQPDGTVITTWSGFSDPRSVIERPDGQVWLSTAGNVYRLNSDATQTALTASNFDTLSVAADGTTWGTVWGSRALYQFDSSGAATAWLPNGPFTQPSSITPLGDGSLLVPDYNNARIYRVLPDKTVTVATEVMQGAYTQPHLLHLFRDGDHWLLSTSNGIYRFSNDWEGQRVTWSAASQMAHLSDGSVIFVVSGTRGTFKLLTQNEPVAASLTRYEHALDIGAGWLQAQGVSTDDNLHMAQQLWGLGEAYRFYQTRDVARAASIKTKMDALAASLRTNQRVDGGWGRTTGYGSDALVTAQTGLALDYTDPSAGDPAIRKAVAWLLTQQQADGSWSSSNGIMSTHESTTTMVAIWLPTILDRLGSIDAQVSATFPPNVQPSAFVPTPDRSTTDAAGNLVVSWALTGVTDAGRDLGFDLKLVDMAPDEARAVAVDAHMTFNNSFNQQIVTLPIAVPSVTANSTVALTVATDHPQYPGNSTAQITTTLLNGDGIPVNGTLTVDVYDANGLLVGHVTQQDVTIPQGSSLPVTDPFAIGTIAPATYTVKALLADNGHMLAHGQTTFLVLPDSPSALATSTVRTDRQTYNPSDRVQILSHVQSTSANAVQSNLALKVSVYDAGNTLQFTHTYAIAQLLAGQGLDFSVPEQLANAPPGLYTVKQDLVDAQTQLLSHVETVYNVASSGDTGFGLVGTISATPKTLPVGGTLTLNASAANQGNSALTNLPLHITVVDPDTGNALQEFDQVSTIAAGASVPFQTTWVTQGHTGTNYLAVLSAQVGSGANAHSITLAVDTFQLSLSLAADLSLTATPAPLAALVLIDPGTPAAESTRVSNTLASMNYVASFASNAADFSSGVRSGAYQVYLLLATNATPDATTLRLVREGVHRGEGLLAANGASGLPGPLAQAIGLTASAELPVINAQTIDVLAAAPGGVAHVSLNPSLASRIVVPQSAQTLANLTGRLPATPDQGTLADELASKLRVDVGYTGNDSGSGGTHLSLTGAGRIRNGNSDHYSVWRIRNSGDSARTLSLTSVSGGYSLPFTMTGHTDTFIASPIVVGTADHRLTETTHTIQTASEPTTVFVDTRIVDVGDNPGAIAMWANSRTAGAAALQWAGSQHTSHGAIQSNAGVQWAGSQNTIDGPVHYVTTFQNSGSQNTFSVTPRVVPVQPLPQLINVDDYRPGGPVQAAVGAAYLDQTAECAKKHVWQRNGSSVTLASGVYWIPCNVHLAGSNFKGNVTLVSTGTIQLSGSSANFTPYYQGLQFASTQSCSAAIQLSTSSLTLGGLVWAPNGEIEASGSNSLYKCSLIGDTIHLAGAKITLDPRQCAYAPIQRRTPAVLWNNYGSGRTAYSAFDWQAAIAAYETIPGALGGLFTDSLVHVAPTQNTLRAGSIVPLLAEAQNRNDPFQGLLTLQASDTSMFTPAASWALDFSQQNAFTAHSNVRLGVGTGTTITANVSASSPIIIPSVKQATVSITHLSGESINDLVVALNAISNRDAGLNNALTALNAAQVSMNAGDREGSLQHLLDAAEACGTSTNAQADALRTRVDWVVWATTH
ncbi:MAG: carboxypeptidase regulatory-like domain-containing protein [Dokdonella sp.]